MTRPLLRNLLPLLLVAMAGADLATRLWVGVGEFSHTVAARDDGTDLLRQAQWRAPPQPGRFDPFHDEVRSRATGEQDESGAPQGGQAQYHYTYQLLATTHVPGGASRALLRMEQRPASGGGKAETRIEVLQQGDSLGDARLLAVSNGQIVLESASHGQQTMSLFIPPEAP